MVSSATSISNPSNSDRATELAELGWRYETINDTDGTTALIQVPLTPEEFLHPREGYRLPKSTLHDQIAGDARDMLTRRYADRPDVGVFRDLLIEWEPPELRDHCPDTFVAFGIQNRDQNRQKFIVANEGVRPTLVIEVVSPRYRKEDREIKVVEYARAEVQEYVIIDRRTYRGQLLEEVLGYRLVAGHYQPITPDDDGRILCETVRLWMSLRDGQLLMEDADNGQRLKTSLELEAENQELQAKNRELEAAKHQAEQQAIDLAAQLARYQTQFGNLPEQNPPE
jgi:Uma2 family endonuclease